MGFLNWLKSRGWWGENRCHAPCGQVHDADSIRIDINKEKSNATHIFDCRHEDLWALIFGDRKFDFIAIDPPYSKELARDLYDTEQHYSSIDVFVNAAKNFVTPGGYLVTLSYQVPKRIKGFDIVAHYGVFQAMSICHIRSCQIWKKHGERRAMGLKPWLPPELEH